MHKKDQLGISLVDLYYAADHSRAMRTYRKLTQIIMERLVKGPARPCEILRLLDLPPERFDLICSTMTRLHKTGRIHKTRIVLTGRHGGNVAVVYQLLQ